MTNVEVSVAWVLLSLAAAAGSAMVIVAMFEELPGIVRDTADRSFKRQRFGPRRETGREHKEESNG